MLAAESNSSLVLNSHLCLLMESMEQDCCSKSRSKGHCACWAMMVIYSRPPHRSSNDKFSKIVEIYKCG